MFHPEELLNKEYIRKVWQAANELPTGTVTERDLPEICRHMDTLITSEGDDVRQKLSLRTSATFINGAARLYKKASDNILDDIMSLHMNIAQRKRYLSNGSTIPLSKRNKTKFRTKYKQNRPESDRHSKKIRSQCTKCKHVESGINMNLDPTQKDSVLISTTSSAENNNKHELLFDNFIEPSIDKNLPYGCLMIYKDYNTRIPSCIVFSSLKNDLKKVLKEHKML